MNVKTIISNTFTVCSLGLLMLVVSSVVGSSMVLAEECLPSESQPTASLDVPPGQDAANYCASIGSTVDDGSQDIDGGGVLIGQRGSCNISESFFGFPTWFKYLDYNSQGQCEVSTIKNGNETDIGKTAAAIGLAVFEIILRLIGIVAVGLVIYGGFQYVLSQGEPDKVKGARTTIINALVGVVIATFAVGAVNLLAGNFANNTDPTGLGLPNPSTTSISISTALRLVLGTAGAIAVIMTIIGGIKYVTSQGNPQETAKAKDTILYALIGLIIVIFAQVIVGYVVTNV